MRRWAEGYHVVEGCLYYDWNDIYDEEMALYLFYDSRLIPHCPVLLLCYNRPTIRLQDYFRKNT